MTAPQPRSRVARVARRAALVAAGLLFGVVLAEGTLRVFDPIGTCYYRDFGQYVQRAIAFPDPAIGPASRIFENKPGLDIQFECFRLVTDDFGMRCGAVGHTTATGRPDGGRDRLRLLFLGDSVTFAWGVEDEESWIRGLEREARDPSGRRVECLNAGHPRYNAIAEADWLAAHGDALAPDAVVLTFVGNDLEDNYAEYLGLVGAADQAAQDAASGRTSFAQRMKARFAAWLPGLQGMAHYYRTKSDGNAGRNFSAAEVREQPEYIEGWPRGEAGLDRVLELCRALGAPLVVLDHATPWIPGVREWCEARGVPWYPFDFSAEERGLAIYNSRADAHANALGNELLEAKAHAALAHAGVLAQPEGRVE